MDFDREELSKQLIKDFEEETAQDELEKEQAASKIKINAPLIIMAVSAFITYAWYSDKFAIRSENAEPKLIKADNLPVRFKPEDPGGMEIANRDKKVYDALSGGDDDQLPKVVKIIPAAEEPLEREDLKNSEVKSDVNVAELLDDMSDNMPRTIGDSEEEKTEDKVAEIEEPVQEREIVQVSDSGEQKLIAKEELMSKDIEIENTARQVAEEIKITPVPRETAKPVVSKKEERGYRVQLGSFKSRDDAIASWNIVAKKYKEIIGNSDHIIEKADLGSKGVFYRLQLGNFKKESESRQVCQELSEQKQGCFIVKK